MAAKGVQMHGLENVDKTDDTPEATPPPAPVEARTTPLVETSAPQPVAPACPPVAETKTSFPAPSVPASVGGMDLAPVAPVAPPTRLEAPRASYVSPTATALRSQPEARRSVPFVPPADFREHKYRVPRTFRFDVDLLEYIERHEKYRAALEDPRTFTEKVNDWVRSQMNDENPVLLQAETDVMGLRAGRRSQETVETNGAQPSLEPPLAPQTQPASVEPPEAPSTTPATPVTASTAPQKKGPSIWDLEKQIKSGKARGNSGTL